MGSQTWYLVASSGEVQTVSHFEDRPADLTPWDLSARLTAVLLTVEAENVSGTYDFHIWRSGKQVRRLQFSAESGGWLIRKGKPLAEEKTAVVRKYLARTRFSSTDVFALVSALLGREPEGTVELWPKAPVVVYVPPPPSAADELLRAVKRRDKALIKKWGRDKSARAELEEQFCSEYSLDKDAVVLLAGLDVLGPRARAVQAHVDELFQVAVRADDLKTVRARLACRPDVSAALHFARSAGAVKVLMSAGAEVNGKNADGLTPLMSLVSRPWPSTLEVVRALSFHGADVGLKAKGRTALQLLEGAVAEGGAAFASWTKGVSALLSEDKGKEEQTAKPRGSAEPKARRGRRLRG